MSLPAFEIILQ